MRDDFSRANSGKGKRTTNRVFTALVLMCFAYTAIVPVSTAQTSTRTAAHNGSDPLHQFNRSVRTLVKRVRASVVQVRVSGYAPVATSRGATSLVLGRQESIGSGVIIDPDGYVLTNAHVIRGAHRAQVNIPAVANDESPEQSLISQRGRTVDARIQLALGSVVHAVIKASDMMIATD